MKYYEFQGRPDKATEETWKRIKKLDPEAQELTKEEYEKRMGIGQPGQQKKVAEDVGSAVVENPTPEDETPVYGGSTKKELIEILKERGFKAGELSRKNKQQLLEML